MLNYFENENDFNTRFFIFDLIFGDIYNHNLLKTHIKILLSTAISLQAKNTLECFTKWIQINIGNEIIQNLFEQLLVDHFSLLDENKNSLASLATTSPVFTSLFISILLDIVLQSSLNYQSIIIKILNQFHAWFTIEPTIAIMSFKENLNHSISYMMNPFPGLLYIIVIYPLMMKESDENYNDMEEKIENLNFNFIKLVREIDLITKSGKNMQDNQNISLINQSNLELIKRSLHTIMKNNGIELNDKRLQKSLNHLAQALVLLSKKNLSCILPLSLVSSQNENILHLLLLLQKCLSAVHPVPQR